MQFIRSIYIICVLSRLSDLINVAINCAFLERVRKVNLIVCRPSRVRVASYLKLNFYYSSVISTNNITYKYSCHFVCSVQTVIDLVPSKLVSDEKIKYRIFSWKRNNRTRHYYHNIMQL